MSTGTQLPEPPSNPNDGFQKELVKLRYQAELEMYKAERQAELEIHKVERQAEIEEEKLHNDSNIEREKADWANEYALGQEMHKAYIEIAKGQIERARASATFVQTVAATIGTVYSGIVALTFGVGEHAKPLPVTGVLPVLFLGLSFVYAAFFMAYLTSPKESFEKHPVVGTLSGNQIIRRNDFIRWVRVTAIRRKEFLQASVISLGLGILFFPVPYLDLNLFIWGVSAKTLIVVGVIIGIIFTLIPVWSFLTQSDKSQAT
jgi:hypothetical protein